MKTKSSLIILTLALIVVVIVSCRKSLPDVNQTQESFSATPNLPSEPYDYRASKNDNIATLGRVLFYDKNLSRNNSVACASCHQQDKAFCDNMQFSTGLEDMKTRRNSPSIFARTGRMFWDGRANGIQDLVLKPVKNHVEMKFENLQSLADKISRIEYYPDLFKKAFGSAEIDTIRIQKALAEFVTNFDFSNNKFGRSRRNIEKLTASEQLGQDLFFGKARCSNCHHVESNIVIPIDTLFDPSPGSGGYGSTDEHPAEAPGVNIGLDRVYADNGSGELSNDPGDNGKFVLPVLLNVEYTSPYMHDGRFKTLDEVVEHYNSGIQDHPNLDFRLRDLSSFGNMDINQIQSKLDKNHNGLVESSEMTGLKPTRLNLSVNEKKNLVDFLKTLSDPSILREVKFSNPFAVK
jgi:cytochrome c peroxidase